MKAIVVTHAVKAKGERITPCPDGIASLWVVSRTLGGLENLEIVWQQHLAAKEYEEGFIVPFDCLDRAVIFVDFVYPAAIMNQIAKMAKTLLVLDHHEDKAQLIGSLDKFSNRVTGKYSPKEKDCGATLAWRHFFPDEKLPWFLNHVWERDCGVNGYYLGEIPKSEAFNTWLVSARYAYRDIKDSLAVYDRLLEMSEPSEEMVDLAPLVHRDKLCDAEIDRWLKMKQSIILAGWSVPLIQIFDKECDRFYSQVAAAFRRAVLRGDVEHSMFVAIKTSSDLKTFHLRGFEGCCFNLGELAKGYGGGGHAMAAGFTIE